MMTKRELGLLIRPVNFGDGRIILRTGDTVLTNRGEELEVVKNCPNSEYLVLLYNKNFGAHDGKETQWYWKRKYNMVNDKDTRYGGRVLDIRKPLVNLEDVLIAMQKIIREEDQLYFDKHIRIKVMAIWVWGWDLYKQSKECRLYIEQVLTCQGRVS